MYGSVVSFFTNLPPRQCSKCGSEIMEQADCYLSQCFDCMDLHLAPMTVSPRFVVIHNSKPA